MRRHCGASNVGLSQVRTGVFILFSVAATYFVTVHFHTEYSIGDRCDGRSHGSGSKLDRSLFIGVPGAADAPHRSSNGNRNSVECPTQCPPVAVVEPKKDCKRCLQRCRATKKRKSMDSGGQASKDESQQKQRAPSAPEDAACEEIKMSVNGEYQQSVCLRRVSDDSQMKARGNAASHIFLPFSFVKKYFDMPGNVEISDNGEAVLTHSHGRLYKPTATAPYRPLGPYLNFENSSVELRGKLQCIDGVESVPRSQRDDANAYFYPIQIAQYGLKHYSLLKSHGEEKDNIILDTELPGHGQGPPNGDKSKDIVINVPDRKPAVVGELSTQNPPVLVVGYRFTGKSTITVRLKAMFYKKKVYSQDMYAIHYTGGTVVQTEPAEPIRCDSKSKEIFYDVGSSRKWRTIARSLPIDLQKGLAVCKGNRARSNGLNENVVVAIQVQRLEVRGSHQVRTLHLNGSAHEHFFLSVADWFLAHQDAWGSWTVPVERSMSSQLRRKGGVMPLKPPWRSAMAQGQGISVLVRAFHHTGKAMYLDAALNATKAFHYLAKESGVQAIFMQKYKWYEEYPTNPPTFVLNGFMSSLIGLYDLVHATTAARGKEAAAEAEGLFKDGFESLHAMLPLYDTGSGSVYDLRHFTAKQAPNIARAEYHVTHLNQLATFCSLFPEDKGLREVYTRWLSYHNGHKARHN